MNKIVLPVPVSANRNWQNAGRGRLRKSNAAKAYQESAGWEAAAQREQYIENAPICVIIDVYRPRKKGDLDNYLKVLLDTLEGVLYGNDNQIVEIHARRHDDPAEPRVEVIVKAA